MAAVLGFLAKYLGVPLLKYVFEKILAAAAEYVATQNKLKKIKKTVRLKKEKIKGIKDAQKKAQKLKDYLSSPSL